MKITKHELNRFLCLVLWALCVPVAYAELTATVYPGYTLSANERPTTAILNLLARPTVSVSGTLGGTNVGLAANTVSGAMLQTSVVDDNTIEFFNNGGSTAIRLKAYNTGTNAISSNLAGLGLGGGDGYALSNKTDNVSLTITNDVLTLMTNLSATYLNVASNGVVVGTSTNRGQTVDMQVFAKILGTNGYASAELTLSSGSALLNAAHNYGYTPGYVRGALICKTVDAGYAVGDEVDFAGIVGVENGGSFDRGKVFSVGANATNVFCSQSGNFLYVPNKTNGVHTQLDHSKWKVKIYARP